MLGVNRFRRVPSHEDLESQIGKEAFDFPKVLLDLVFSLDRTSVPGEDEIDLQAGHLADACLDFCSTAVWKVGPAQGTLEHEVPDEQGLVLRQIDTDLPWGM